MFPRFVVAMTVVVMKSKEFFYDGHMNFGTD
jgi:hypothetical protein